MKPNGKNTASITLAARDLHFSASVAILLATQGPVVAATATWDGLGTGNVRWATADYWVGNVLPTFNNTLDVNYYPVGAGNLYHATGARTIRSLNFDANADAAVTLVLREDQYFGAARNLIFDADSGNAKITVASGSAGNHTIGVLNDVNNGSVVLADNLDVTHNGSGTLTIARPVTGTLLGINKAGTGTMVLSGQNTYTGATSITGGSLQASHANALGTIAGGTTVSSGAELSIASAITLAAEALTLNGAGISGIQGALHIAGGATAGVSGAITLGSNATIKGDGGTTLNLTGGIGNAGNTLTLLNDGGANINVNTAGISGGGGLTKTGDGTVTLNTANGYSGVTTISGGTLALGVSADIDSSSAVVLAGGNFNVTTATGFNIVSGQALKGNGTVIGDIAIDGTLDIGTSPGTITFNDDLILQLGSVSKFEINSFTVGNFDLAKAAAAGSQSLTINGGTLNLLFQTGFNTSGSVEIFDFDSYAGTGFTTLNYEGLASGYTASFNAATGIVTVIPEPFSAMLGSFGLFALLRRRRN